MNINDNLTPLARQQLILDIIKKHKSVLVKPLAAELFINEATIRRDLNTLENTGLIKRTYGGAILIEGLDAEIPFFARETSQTEEKDIIGMMAADLVKDGDTIILDSSSTALRMIKYLMPKKNLKVITNGAKTAFLLTKLNDCTIYCTGGKMRENSLSFIGLSAIEFIKNFYADICFFSCRSLSADAGLTDSSEEEALLRRVMISSSNKSVLLLDSSKINTRSFYKICDTEKITHILCDKLLPNNLKTL